MIHLKKRRNCKDLAVVRKILLKSIVSCNHRQERHDIYFQKRLDKCVSLSKAGISKDYVWH